MPDHVRYAKRSECKSLPCQMSRRPYRVSRYDSRMLLRSKNILLPSGVFTQVRKRYRLVDLDDRINCRQLVQHRRWDHVDP